MSCCDKSGWKEKLALFVGLGAQNIVAASQPSNSKQTDVRVSLVSVGLRGVALDHWENHRQNSLIIFVCLSKVKSEALWRGICCLQSQGPVRGHMVFVQRLLGFFHQSTLLSRHVSVGFIMIHFLCLLTYSHVSKMIQDGTCHNSHNVTCQAVNPVFDAGFDNG